ncbi:MAG: hypothetical protein ACM3U2_12060 [Deltaproteobacteria bacterium]
MNPFRDTIVASPWETTCADVPEIHGQVFDRCLEGIEHVRQGGRSAALLIHGEAGSGKTHLLSRLRARLAPQAPTASGRPECLFVWVRLQTSPRMIWRTLRRTLVDDWFRPVAGAHSQFHRILFHRLAEIRTAEGDLERWYEYMLDEVPEGLAELMEKIATRLDLDRNTAVAFMHIAFGRHVRDLRAWLAGTSLPQAALDRMDLAQDEGTDEEREDESRRIVLMLCRLAGNGLPIVLSFDQVEALQMTPHDPDALYSFGQMISTLHDGTTNALLVSCVQSAFHTELKDDARRADYDRMTSLGALSLDPLDRAQAERLIAARRAADADSAPRSGCWPLEPREFEDLFAHGFVTPRQLLSLCAERLETRSRAAAGGAPPGPDSTGGATPEPGRSVATFLEDAWGLCLEQKLAANGPEKTEEIVRHGLPLLLKLTAPEAKFVRDEQLPDVSLIFEGPRGRAGLSVCTQSNMTSLAARFKRLKTQFALRRLDRLVLLRESRIPLSPGAKAARQYLEELEQQQAIVVFPTVEALAALDALRELLSDAKSGDLACQGRAISPQTVEEWLTTHVSAPLRDFGEEVLGMPNDAGPNASDTRDIEALNGLLAQQPMLSLEEAARSLRRPIEEVAAAARRHPRLFGLLGQPPTTLFRAVSTAESPPARAP